MCICTITRAFFWGGAFWHKMAVWWGGPHKKLRWMAGTGWLAGWLPREAFSKMRLFLIRVGREARMVSSPSFLFHSTFPPSSGEREKKILTQIEWRMDLVAIWTSVFSFTALARERARVQCDRPSTAMWTNTGDGGELSVRLEPQRFAISSCQSRKHQVVWTARRKSQLIVSNRGEVGRVWDHYSRAKVSSCRDVVAGLVVCMVQFVVIVVLVNSKTA